MSLGKTPKPIKLDERTHAAKPPEHLFPEPLGLQRTFWLIGKYIHAMGGMQAESEIMGMAKNL